MSYVALAIRDAIPATESYERTSSGRLLSEHPDLRAIRLYEDLPDEVAESLHDLKSFEEQVWQLFFDGTSRMGPIRDIVARVWVVLLSSQNYVIAHAFSLTESCSNNIAEYNALLIGMQLIEEIGVKNFEAYGDSNLIVNQVRGEYEVRHEELMPYQHATINMEEKFRSLYIDYVPRQQNAHADVLASPLLLIGPSSQNHRESTHLQPRPVAPKIRL